MIKKITTLFLFFSYYILVAQINKTIPEFTQPSPDVASLGKYGDLPLDYYTGTANIQVPLHTINFDGLEIPLSLSYNTGGIKVAQEATWVGLGWTLSSEPIITRQIKGLCDLTTGAPLSPTVGFIDTDVALPEYAADISPTLRSKIQLYEDMGAQLIRWDTQPDIFTVNLFGESAKFILTQKALNGGIVGVKLLNPDSRLKVIFDYATRNFTVTNAEGFVFYFTKKEFSVTGVGAGYNFNVYSGFSDPLITGWKIEKIISPKDNILNYNYSEAASINDIPVESSFIMVRPCINTPTVNVMAPYENKPQRASTVNSHATLYLASIVSNNSTITFNTSGRNDIIWGHGPPLGMVLPSINGFGNGTVKKLDQIVIKNQNNQQIKKIDFEYSYFTSLPNTHPVPQEILRLKLDKIILNNQFYRGFEYNTNVLPRKSSFDTDYWGYYNGKRNMLGYPTYKDRVNCDNGVLQVIGADKTPDFNFGSRGLLNKVIYPTRGYSILNYEAHDIELNEQTKNIHYPFEDYEALQITSYGESAPATSQVVAINATPMDSFYTETLDGTQPLFGVALLEIACGGKFTANGGLDYRKCNVATPDVGKTAFQMINADTGEIAISRIFSNDPSCFNPLFFCPPLVLNYAENYVRKQAFSFANVPPGNYYFRVKALKEMSNMYDGQMGIPQNDPDFAKPYYFAVRFTLNIPKSNYAGTYNKKIGGARIQSIVNYNHDGIVIDKKEYKYRKEGFMESSAFSSGILLNDINFDQQDKILANNTLESSPGSLGVIYKILNSNNIQEQYAPGQNHIGYSRVEEIYSNDGKSNGKKVLYFANRKNENATIGSQHSHVIFNFTEQISSNLSLYPRMSYEQDNGDLLKEELYNSLGQKIKMIEYDYQYHDYNPARKVDVGLLPRIVKQYNFSNNSFSGITGRAEDMQIYPIKDEYTPLITKKETNYFNGQTLTNSINYFYDNPTHLLPTRVETTNSKGEQLMTKTRYPDDIVDSAYLGGDPSTPSEMAAFNRLKTGALHRISEPIQIESYVNGILSGVKKTVYRDWGANFVLPEKIMTIKGTLEFSFTPRVTYNQYDSSGNPVELQLEEGMNVVYLWGYSKTMPIAKIENANFSQVAIALGTDISSLLDFNEANLPAINGLRTSLPEAMVTTFTYIPLVGIQTVTDPKGDTMTYEYDAFSRLKSVKDHQGNILSSNDYNYRPN